MTKFFTIIFLLTLSVCSCGQTKQKQTKAKTETPTTVYLPRQKDTFQYFSIADTNYSKYTLPTNFVKPKKWKQADKNRKGMLGDWYGGKTTLINPCSPA